MAVQAILLPAGGVGCTYASADDLEARYGTARLAEMLPPEQPFNTAATAAIVAGCNEVDALLSGGPYTLPIETEDTGALYQLKAWATVLAAEWAWRHRGNYDTDGNKLPDGPFTADANAARQRLRLVAAGVRRITGAALRPVPE
jgi:hypothetical protein